MPDRTKQPPFQKSLQFNLKEPVAIYEPGRAPVFLLNGGEQDVLRLELVFRAGRWFEPQAGLAHFTAALLNKGTPQLSATDIASRLEELGYHIETGALADFAHFTAYGLADNFIEASEIIRACLTESNFPNKELKQEKEIYLQHLKVNQEKTSYMAARLFRQQLFGRTHPYALEPETEHLQALSSSLLAGYFSSYFRDFEVYVTGKLNSRAERAIIQLVHHLPWQKHTEPEWPLQPSSEKRATLAKPEAVQASLRIGKPCISRHHPDYPILVLAVYLLGGCFGSRLMKIIREEKGLTYGIHAHIYSFRHAAFFSISADVNRLHTDDVVTENA